MRQKSTIKACNWQIPPTQLSRKTSCDGDQTIARANEKPAEQGFSTQFRNVLNPIARTATITDEEDGKYLKAILSRRTRNF
jgi:hypothetical protein